ncbi:ribonuclease H-like domain-containing protein [Tanacetum coccineum]
MSVVPSIIAYTDADWDGYSITCRSTLGCCVFLGDNLLSWSAKWQITFSHSSAKAEYHGVANVVAENVWLQNLLIEWHAPLSTAAIVYYDNIMMLLVRFVCFMHRPGSSMNIFTKSLPSALFLEFRSRLNARSPLAQTTGEY